MTLTNRIIAFGAGLLMYTGSVSWVLIEVYKATEPTPPLRALPTPPVPYVDPPGITPQMRIDATWACLQQISACRRMSP